MTVLVYRTISVLRYLPYMCIVTQLHPYLTPVHSERKECPFNSFCHWVPSSSSSPGTLSQQLSPLSPLSSTLPHPILFFNLNALSGSTLKQALMPAHLHSLTWLTPTCLSLLRSCITCSLSPCFSFSLFPELPGHKCDPPLLLYYSLLASMSAPPI